MKKAILVFLVVCFASCMEYPDWRVVCISNIYGSRATMSGTVSWLQKTDTGRFVVMDVSKEEMESRYKNKCYVMERGHVQYINYSYEEIK